MNFRATLLASFLLFLPDSLTAQELPLTLDEDFSGWTLTRDPDSWAIEEGVLTLVNDPERKGSILWTKQAYGDFIIEFEFKSLEGVVDSGVFLRQENDQIQIGHSGSLKRDMTASPYISGKGYPVEAEGVAELLRPEGWNAMKVVAVGDRYDVWLNGQHVMNYQSETSIEKGPVGLQLHPGNIMKMQYRNVRIAELQDPVEN